MKRKKLTPKQRAFVLEFPKDFNATKAAERAKYSKKTARQMGSENLSKPYIVAAIEKQYELMAMSLEEALARMSSVARGQTPPDVEELKSHDVIQALKTILKHHGALIDRLVVDWKHEAQAHGIDPSDMFEEMVNFFTEKISEEVDED